jgi:hypothetical protein
MKLALGLGSAAVIALAAAASGVAGHDRPVPVEVRAHAGDGFAQRARTQFWRIHAADARGERVVTVAIWATPKPHVIIDVFNPRLDAAYQGRTGAQLWGTRARPSRHGTELLGTDGALAKLERGPRGWRFDAQGPGAAVDIRLEPIARGVRAGPWRLARQGDEARPAVVHWATPAPLARVRVRVRTPEGLTAFRSTRGYLDHTWGSVDLDQEAWDDWALVQMWAGGRSTVVHGLINSWDLSGSASREAMFRAVLVRASRRRTSVCEPFVQWHSFPSPGSPRVRARCSGRWIVISSPARRRSPYFGGEQTNFWKRDQSFARYVRRPHGTGVVETIDHQRCLETCY